MTCCVEPKDAARAADRDQLHLAPLARLKPHGGARRDIKPHAARRVAVKIQRRVGFGKMIVAADLHRPVAGVGDHQGDGVAPVIQGQCRPRRGRFLRGSWACSYRIGL